MISVFQYTTRRKHRYPSLFSSNRRFRPALLKNGIANSRSNSPKKRRSRLGSMLNFWVLNTVNKRTVQRMPAATRSRAVMLSKSGMCGSASNHARSVLLQNGSSSHKKPPIPSAIYVELSQLLIVYSLFSLSVFSQTCSLNIVTHTLQKIMSVYRHRQKRV